MREQRRRFSSHIDLTAIVEMCGYFPLQQPCVALPACFPALGPATPLSSLEDFCVRNCFGVFLFPFFMGLDGRFSLFRLKLIATGCCSDGRLVLTIFLSLHTPEGTSADRRDASGDRGGVRRCIRGRCEGPSLRLCQVGLSAFVSQIDSYFIVTFRGFVLLVVCGAPCSWRVG